MSKTWRTRIRWLALGLLLALSGSVVASMFLIPDDVGLPADVRESIVKKLRAQHADIVKQKDLELAEKDELLTEYGEEIARQIRLRERAEGHVKWRDRIIRIPGEPPPPEVIPGEPVYIDRECRVSGGQVSGDCKWEKMDIGGLPYARLFWKGAARLTVNETLVEIPEEEWVQVDEFKYEIAKVDESGPKWTKAYWLDGLVADSMWGVGLGVSWHRKRWGAKVSAGALFGVEEADLVDAPSFFDVDDDEVKPYVGFSLSRKVEKR